MRRRASRAFRWLFGEGHWIAWLLAAVAVMLQMLTNGCYGYFRDEVYFIATSNHLDWGYVDFAPLAAFLLKISRTVFGSSLHALRLFPALAFGGEVLLAGVITRELGGRWFAIFISCAAVLLGPAFVGEATRYSMNAFEPLFWMGSICVFSGRSIAENQSYFFGVACCLVWVSKTRIPQYSLSLR
jgi:4-amino-4-deoxy-L-arabinose transferase-like glycosyltransferase